MAQCHTFTRAWLNLPSMAAQAQIPEAALLAACLAGEVKARLTCGIWKVWADAQGLPGDPSFFILEWVDLKPMASQARIADETLRDQCRTGKVRCQKVGGVWKIWADADGFPGEPDDSDELRATAAR